MNWKKTFTKYLPFLKTKKRAFNAASINRLTNDWAYSIININEDIKKSLKVLKGRSRELSKNNAYYRKYLSMREKNIVGPQGFTLQMKIRDVSGKNDNYANDNIEQAWYDWSNKKTCTVDGKLSFTDVCNLCVRMLAVDGEYFVRKVKNFGNKYKYALQIIDSAACDIDYCDSNLSGGNRIIMGVEIDQWDRPVAYYFRASSYENTFYENKYFNGKKYVKIPAEEIIHGFHSEYPGQVRGIPKATASMLAMNMLNGYSEAELVASRASACKMILYQKDSATGTVETSGSAPGADVKDGDQFIEEMSPGKSQKVPDGYKPIPYDPTHPNANYEAFVRAELREIAGGLDVSYNSLASDLTSVNFSSMRGGVQEERDGWKGEQRETIEQLCEPVFEDWLTVYLLTGLSSLPFSKYDKFNQAVFIPRSFQWVDPRADADANVTMITNRLKPPQAIIAEMGLDPDDVLFAFQKWDEMIKKYGLQVNKEPLGKEEKNEN